MKKITSVLIASALVAGLAGCADQYGQGGITGAQGGTVLGGVAGGVIGSQIGSGTGNVVAIIGGTLLGAFLGHEIGVALDQQSQSAANQAARTAFETGRTTYWRSGNAYGSIKPGRKYMPNATQVCRPFKSTVVVLNGQTKVTRVVYGTACRNKGMWYCSPRHQY